MAGRPPNVLVETAKLSREEWLAYRRQGIGGSDAASVLGISPFRTGVDLYYDKLGHPIEDSEENWVAMEMGNLLEDLVARIFEKKTGLKVVPMKFMFQHADHPWMLADIDRIGGFLCNLDLGSNGITSADRKNRREFNRMIAACKRGEIDMILTKSVSRFARSIEDCLEIMRALKAIGVGVMFERENINTLGECVDLRLSVFAALALAQAESESLEQNFGKYICTKYIVRTTG